MSLIGYGVGSAWQSIAHGIAFAGYGIAVVVMFAAFPLNARGGQVGPAHGARPPRSKCGT